MTCMRAESRSTARVSLNFFLPEAEGPRGEEEGELGRAIDPLEQALGGEGRDSRAGLQDYRTTSEWNDQAID